MAKLISVVVPTYNPDIRRLNLVLDGLRKQTFPTFLWELIIVDNNSSNQFANHIDLAFQPDSQILTEKKQGLTYARLAGFSASRSDIVILVDDDNVLSVDYLQECSEALRKHPNLGAIGGKVAPEFEAVPPHWLSEFNSLLAVVDHGEKEIICHGSASYPSAAPVGAGICIRKAAIAGYINKILSSKAPVPDRTATSLSSGGDNDIVLSILTDGWHIGYFPSLYIKHIIPAFRIKPRYLARLNKSSNESWVNVLENYGINPWPKIAYSTLLPRKIKAWFTYKAWKGHANYIKWKGACGMFNALARHYG